MSIDNWNIQKAMLSVIQTKHIQNHVKIENITINEHTLAHSLIFLANLTEAESKEYLLLFERLKHELRSQNDLNYLKDFAFKIAKKGALEIAPEKYLFHNIDNRSLNFNGVFLQ